MGNCLFKPGDVEDAFPAVEKFKHEFDVLTDPARRQARKEREWREAAEKRLGELAPKARPPKCSICLKHCQISLNPWQCTYNARRVADVSDESDAETEDANGIAEVPLVGRRRKQELRGIQLESCKHRFCGACLAQVIYDRLNITFDRTAYGTELKPPPVLPSGRRPDFPISCPKCQVKPGEQPVEISDMTARLVLGESNMPAWDRARFLTTHNIIYCPHKGCDEAIDVDAVAAPDGIHNAETLVQCPKCRGFLCKTCKCIWHDDLTCARYQALPEDVRAPEDVPFADLAKQNKWRRCPKCLTWFELKFGCYHIICVCKHHFCYTCGADFEYKYGKYRCTGGLGCKIWDEQYFFSRD
ncbi:hypothetical protein FB451DRAFT_1564085 [Mycena latifolia]|nr:hypothetical protein FB451DRAFT_1564085 [Mycena latifolia]